MPVTVTPLTPSGLAAEIGGVDIGRGVDDADFEAIHAAFDEHSVLVFRHQSITPESQTAFGERFGPLEITVPGTGGAGTKFARISNVGEDGNLLPVDGQRFLFSKANQLWHTDSSFKAVPAMASILAAYEVPPEGGETEFASMRLAYAALPEEEKHRLEGKVAVHSLAHSRRKIAPDAITEEQMRAVPPVEQAMVRVNPRNGRKAYYVASHAMAVKGMPEDEARAWIDELVEFATRPERTYVHRWSPGEVVMWDNRCCLHRGRPWDATRHRRVLLRTTVSCPGPTVAEGRPVAHAI